MKLPILDVTRPELLEPKLEFCEYPEESSHEAFGPESKDGKARPEKIYVKDLLVNLSFTISTIAHTLVNQPTPGPHLMRIHLVRNSTSARYEKYSNIHLVRPIIHLVRIFALSTS